MDIDNRPLFFTGNHWSGYLIAFVDFEASSLEEHSYPIEVAWAFEDGTSYSTLIRPAMDWSDWSMDAESIHRISRELLWANGAPVEVVAHLMLKQLEGHSLFASAPSWDGKWLSVLLRAAGLPRHALRLARSNDALVALAAEILGPTWSSTSINAFVADAISGLQLGLPAHRALPDAQAELSKWRNVGRRAVARAKQSGGGGCAENAAWPRS